MSLRRETNLHLSSDVLRALWLLSRAESNRAGQNITVDELADKRLRDSLQATHPQLFEHQKKIESMERDLLKTLSV